MILGNINDYIVHRQPEGKLIAIGDIHGCLHTLQALLSSIHIDKEKDLIVFLGDYVDRGPFPCETVQFVRKLRSVFNVVYLRGNHEQFMLENNCQYDLLWDINGGFTTRCSYENNGIDPSDDVTWISDLPLVLETDEYIFCHAGLTRPELLKNKPHDILWNREWLNYSPLSPREKTVIFGHTPKLEGAYVLDNGDLCLDSGCVFGGSLSAAIIDGDDIAIMPMPLHEKDREGNQFCEW